RRLEGDMPIPHMGWNQLHPTRPHPMLEGVADGAHVYFVHSYWCDAPAEVVLAETDYGARFPAIVGRGNVLGVQFHPEKSQAVGAVIDAVVIPVEVGGGLRVLEIAMRYRDRGADRVVFGTAAIADPGVVQEAARLWPESVAVALDARNGKVAVAGWKEITRVDAVELARRVKGWGVSR